MRVMRNDFNSARNIFSWADTLVFAAVFVILLFTFVFRTATVEGPSMIPTLHNNERLIISGLFYKTTPGDIVVIDSKVSETRSIVKRVIATEGQTVEVNADTGDVLVDGKVLKEDYIPESLFKAGESIFITGDQVYPLTVPKGKIFVMGDNRNVSLDSRYIEVGCIDTRYVLGRVLFRMAPLNKIGVVN